MKKKLFALFGVLSLFGVAYGYVNWVGIEEETLKRPAFEGLDRTRLHKAYNRVHLDIVSDKLNVDDIDTDTEEGLVQMDKILIETYHKIV